MSSFQFKQSCRLFLFGRSPQCQSSAPSLTVQFPLHFDPTPYFLGVTLGTLICKHIYSVNAKQFLCLKGLRCISASSLTLYSTKLFFNLFSPLHHLWLLFLSAANVTKLECLHQSACSAIATASLSCPPPYRSLWPVSPCHCISRPFVFQFPFLFQVLPDML